MKPNNIEYLFGKEDSYIIASRPFDEKVVEYLEALSKAIRQDKEAKQYPDVITFAFWVRKANLENLKKVYENSRLRIGKGMVFHIAPSNVPINFAFSLVFGMLSGNSNIVRASSKDFKQVRIVCRIMKTLSEEEKYRWVEEQNAVVMYERNKEINDYFSSKCSMRIIWGGDNTIREIRQSDIPPRSTEVVFADRYSFGIIDAEVYLSEDEENWKRIANDFYNDTYLVDQNACSTPHFICFQGESKARQKASGIFWKNLYEASKKYDLADSKVSDKYTMLCKYSTELDIEEIKRYENLLYVIRLRTLPEKITELRGKFGLFFEYELKDIQELSNCIDDKVQTLIIHGVEKNKISEWIINQKLLGIDRVVEVGKALDIGLSWDGYDMINTLSREITL